MCTNDTARCVFATSNVAELINYYLKLLPDSWLVSILISEREGTECGDSCFWHTEIYFECIV